MEVLRVVGGAGFAARARRSRRCVARGATSRSAGWTGRSTRSGRVVALYNPRTATAIVPADEVAAFGTAFLPDDDAGLKAIVDSAVPERDEGFAEPVALAVEAISDALDGVTLSRDDLHEALRQRLPGELLPWCEGCESHHARRGLLVMAGLHGRAVHRGAGRAPAGVRAHRPARRLGRRRSRTPAPSSSGATSGSTARRPTRTSPSGRGSARRTRKTLWTRRAPPRASGSTACGVLAPGDPLLLEPRPRGADPGPGAGASRCGRRSRAPASCSPTASRSRCGGRASRARRSR